MIQLGIKRKSVVMADGRHLSLMTIFLGLGAAYGIGDLWADEEEEAALIRFVDEHEQWLQGHFLKYAYNGPERFWHFLHHLIPGQNRLISALDKASWDVHCKVNGRSIFDDFGRGNREFNQEITGVITEDAANPLNENDFDQVIHIDRYQGFTDIKLKYENRELGKPFLWKTTDVSVISLAFFDALKYENDRLVVPGSIFGQDTYSHYSGILLKDGVFRLDKDRKDIRGHGVSIL